MVIVKVNVLLHPKEMAKLSDTLQSQAQNGALVLPPYCQLLDEVPDDTEIQVFAGHQLASDCDECGRHGCEYARSTVRRINCPLWRAKG